MNNISSRFHSWTKKKAGKLSKAPKLASLPPTREAFELNVKRGHCQAAIWKYALLADPPNIDETDYGYDRIDDYKTLEPTMLPPGVEVVPPEIRKLISCGCKANEPCGKGNCTCRATNMGCSVFCKCTNNQCRNPFTTKTRANSESEEDDNGI